MKNRKGFVSNSSSSSFIIWGPGAKEYAEDLKEIEVINADNFADTYYNKELWHWRDDKNKKYNYLPDDEWVKKFDEDQMMSNCLPESLRNLTDKRNSFVSWFSVKYHDAVFYSLEASDHEGETTYHESELMDLFDCWHGNRLYSNNH